MVLKILDFRPDCDRRKNLYVNNCTINKNTRSVEFCGTTIRSWGAYAHVIPSLLHSAKSFYLNIACCRLYRKMSKYLIAVIFLSLKGEFQISNLKTFEFITSFVSLLDKAWHFESPLCSNIFLVWDSVWRFHLHSLGWDLFSKSGESCDFMFVNDSGYLIRTLRNLLPVFMQIKISSRFDTPLLYSTYPHTFRIWYFWF